MTILQKTFSLIYSSLCDELFCFFFMRRSILRRRLQARVMGTHSDTETLARKYEC